MPKELVFNVQGSRHGLKPYAMHDNLREEKKTTAMNSHNAQAPLQKFYFYNIHPCGVPCALRRVAGCVYCASSVRSDQG